MTRYTPDHKAATRRRLLAASARRFKRDGLDGSGIASLVSDAGLTNGAFYGHFSSKDDLIATVVADQLSAQVARLESIASAEDMAAFIRQYLSPQHRDDPAEGCPSAALLDEIARQSEPVRAAYTKGADRVIAVLAERLAGDNTRARAISLFTLLVSSMQLARAVTEPSLSDEVLDSAYDSALRIAGLTPEPEGVAEVPLPVRD